MLVLIEKGILRRPDCIIHADTGSEMPQTYQFEQEVGRPLIDRLGIPYYVVKSHYGRLHEAYREKEIMPLVGSRSCTDNYKILPVQRQLKKLFTKKYGKPSVISWLGITTDEAGRASRAAASKSDCRKTRLWNPVCYPLLELNMSRQAVKDFIVDAGYPVPIKSGCFLCPYQSRKSWIRLKGRHPDLFEIALDLEHHARNRKDGKPSRLRLLGTEGTIDSLNNGSELTDFIAMEFDDYDENITGCDSGGGCWL